MANIHDSVTYSHLIVNALKRQERTDLVAFRQGEVAWTYAEAGDRLARTVQMLKNEGLQRGEGVGVLSPNRPEVWLVQAAPGMAGAFYTALNYRASESDHLYAIRETEMRFLYTDPEYAEYARSLQAQCPSLEKVFVFGTAEEGGDLEEALAAVGECELSAGDHGPEDITWMLYTGGTTGVPKAAMLSERAVGQSAVSVAIDWDLPKDMRYLACAPISHAAGMLVLPTLLAGGTVILQRAFDPAEWLRAVEKEGATVGLLVPTMIYAILDALDSVQADLSSLHTVMYGASPISPTRLAEAIRRIGPVWAQLYGQTECVGIVAVLPRAHHDPDDLNRLSACGYPMVGTRVAVLDDDGNPVAAGESGEICVQGPAVMNGYYKQQELTEETIVDGWLRTGDIATQDDDGLLYIVDRKKDMIVSGGFNVFPREIEDTLAMHPAVSSSAVIGIPDEKWGEAVKALVVLKPGASVTEQELRGLVREEKGAVYVPKSIDFLEALPLTAVGKPDKKSLRAKYWDGGARAVN